MDENSSVPFVVNHKPELDVSLYLGSRETTQHKLLGVKFQWMIELSKVNMITEVDNVASFLAMLREVHIDNMYHILAYLR